MIEREILWILNNYGQINDYGLMLISDTIIFIQKVKAIRTRS